jgi:hypothetical protein
MQMTSERHSPPGALTIREILARMRHDTYGGRPDRVELATGFEGSSRPIRRIVLQGV